MNEQCFHQQKRIETKTEQFERSLNGLKAAADLVRTWRRGNLWRGAKDGGSGMRGKGKLNSWTTSCKSRPKSEFVALPLLWDTGRHFAI